MACKRVNEAVSEIRKVQKQDPVRAAEGAVRLIEKISPAFENVDSSSGALGGTVNKALHALAPIIATARPEEGVRRKWLERIWTAVEDDGIGYLDELTDLWGELFAGEDEASRWADDIIEWVRAHWATNQPRGYFKGTTACLSCLLAAGRYDELLTLLESAPHRRWNYHQFGFRALAAMGKMDEALAYAGDASGINDRILVDRACEELLLSEGRHERAYEKYAMRTSTGNTHISTYRAVARKYPMYPGRRILEDLIASTPGSEGKWFATARSLGFLELALSLAFRSPCDPKTLNRAARDNLEDNPKFALGVAMASLHWLCMAYGYEISSREITDAYRHATESASKLDMVGKVTGDIKLMLESDRSPGRVVTKTLDVCSNGSRLVQ